jgi:hemerythrin superfamily protein
MKVTAYLRKDHETIRSLFARFNNAAGRSQNGKETIFEDIQREISLHFQMEAEIFYPELENTASVRAQELAGKALDEHHEADKMLERLAELSTGDKEFDAKMAELMKMITSHIEAEEEEIFEEARKNLPEYRLEELGLEMEARRRIMTQRAA